MVNAKDRTRFMLLLRHNIQQLASQFKRAIKYATRRTFKKLCEGARTVVANVVVAEVKFSQVPVVNKRIRQHHALGIVNLHQNKNQAKSNQYYILHSAPGFQFFFVN